MMPVEAVLRKGEVLDAPCAHQRHRRGVRWQDEEDTISLRLTEDGPAQL